MTDKCYGPKVGTNEPRWDECDSLSEGPTFVFRTLLEEVLTGEYIVLSVEGQ